MKLNAVKASKKMSVCQKTSPLLIAKIMLVKYIVGLLLLLLCHAALAQELNSVIYNRNACGVIKIKKSGKKIEKCLKKVVKNREAQLIYSSNYVLFKSLQGADTIFLSDIRETGKDFPYARKFYISADSSFIDLFFCNRKNARKFRRFMLENGGHYRKFIAGQIIIAPLIIFGYTLLPSEWSEWNWDCK